MHPPSQRAHPQVCSPAGSADRPAARQVPAVTSAPASPGAPPLRVPGVPATPGRSPGSRKVLCGRRPGGAPARAHFTEGRTRPEPGSHPAGPISKLSAPCAARSRRTSRCQRPAGRSQARLPPAPALRGEPGSAPPGAAPGRAPLTRRAPGGAGHFPAPRAPRRGRQGGGRDPGRRQRLRAEGAGTCPRSHSKRRAAAGGWAGRPARTRRRPRPCAEPVPRAPLTAGLAHELPDLLGRGLGSAHGAQGGGCGARVPRRLGAASVAQRPVRPRVQRESGRRDRSEPRVPRGERARPLIAAEAARRGPSARRLRAVRGVGSAPPRGWARRGATQTPPSQVLRPRRSRLPGRASPPRPAAARAGAGVSRGGSDPGGSALLPPGPPHAHPARRRKLARSSEGGGSGHSLRGERLQVQQQPLGRTRQQVLRLA